MVFIFNLLGDLKTEDSLSKTRSEDSLTRSTVINLIQNDFIKLGLYKWSSCNQSGSLMCMSSLSKIIPPNIYTFTKISLLTVLPA